MFLIKNCEVCHRKFNVVENDIIPFVDESVTVDSEGFLFNKILKFVYRCPACGKVFFLTEQEQNDMDLSLMEQLLVKYAGCTEMLRNLWVLDNKEKKLFYELCYLKSLKDNLIEKLYDKMDAPDEKTHLTDNWIPIKDIIESERTKRKKLIK